MKTYLKDCYGCTGSITDHRDGSATLRIKLPTGQLIHNKIHKSHKAALSAWYRYGA